MKTSRQASKKSAVAPRGIAPSVPLIWQIAVIAIAVFALYGQTLRYGYMLDDRMAITENAVVREGARGIPTLLSKDSFYGFDTELGRTEQRKTYRPVSFVLFALEWQISPNTPLVHRIIHLLLYAGVCAAALLTLRRLFSQAYGDEPADRARWSREWIPFGATLLFALHPIHTEVVCNIKSRDEIAAALCLLLSLNFFLKSIDDHSPIAAVWSSAFWALGLLSKESAVCFLPVFPLSIYFFRPNLETKDMLRRSAPAAAIAAVYLAVWFGAFGRVDDAFYRSPLTNPFANASLNERTATGLWIVALYVGKALFPLTLSHSYTFNAIPLTTWLDWKPLAGLVLCGALCGFAFWRTPRRDALAFCIWFFFCTIALASNLFVYVGGLLGERFLFTPSLGSSLALAVLAATVLRRNHAAAMAAICLVAVGYGARALPRVGEWQSEETLFKADARSTPESYQAQTEYAKSALIQSLQTPDIFEKQARMREALEALEKARRIDSVSDPQLYTIFALCYAEAGDVSSALRYGKIGFERTLEAELYRATPGYVCYAAKSFAQTALKLSRSDNPDVAARGAKPIAESIAMLRLAVQRDTPVVDADVYMTLANCYDALSRYDSALTFSEKALSVRSATKRHKDNYAIITGNYGGALMQEARYAEAAEIFARALRHINDNPRLHWGLGMARQAEGNYAAAVVSLRAALALDPASARLKQDLAQAEKLLSSVQTP